MRSPLIRRTRRTAQGAQAQAQAQARAHVTAYLARVGRLRAWTRLGEQTQVHGSGSGIDRPAARRLATDGSLRAHAPRRALAPRASRRGEVRSTRRQTAGAIAGHVPGTSLYYFGDTKIQSLRTSS